MSHDKTIAYYDADAAAFVARRVDKYSDQLATFIARVGPAARVLELGCGGGHDAEAMLAAGVDVIATDGSAELALQAEKRLGRPVRVMRFDELDELEAYDGVWANRCLLHVPTDELAGVLGRIWRAMKPGASFFASFKAGDGGALDAVGRYYNFPNRADLARTYAAAAPWSEVAIEERDGGDHDGVARKWLLCRALKGS